MYQVSTSCATIPSLEVALVLDLFRVIFIQIASCFDIEVIFIHNLGNPQKDPLQHKP